jgi:NAD(P)-dependent dehydrogenase (short-subunit alcohol dehydrogenase family)
VSDQPVTGRVALVTGGTRGIGAAVTRRLAADGIRVAAVYARDDRRAAQLVAELTTTGDAAPDAPDAPAAPVAPVSAYRCDISDQAACRDLVRRVVCEHGSLDYLVNNAGLLEERRVDRTEPADWHRALGVNLSGPFFLAQAAWEHMAAQGFGRIVNVSSVTAFMGNPREAAYGAAKAGLVGLTRSLARAGARRGITVNCVVPGVFATDMTASMSERDQEVIRGMIPLGRPGRPEEMAHAIRFLLDDQAGYVTGAVLVVDGGLSMGS